MRLDHLLSREYTTTDLLVQIAWREGSFGSLLKVRVLSEARNSVQKILRSEIAATLYSFQGTEKDLERERKRAEPRGYSSAGRAPALQAGGHRFESVYLHHEVVRGKRARMGS